MLNIVILIYSNNAHKVVHTLLNMNLKNLLLMPREHMFLKWTIPQIILCSSTTTLLMRLEQVETALKIILDQSMVHWMVRYMRLFLSLLTLNNPIGAPLVVLPFGLTIQSRMLTTQIGPTITTGFIQNMITLYKIYQCIMMW